MVEVGHSVLFTTATELVDAFAKAERSGQPAEELTFYRKPKLLTVEELGYLTFERRSAHLLLQIVGKPY